MRTAFATLIAFGLIAAPALAQATATATPNTAGKATTLQTTLDATQPPVSGRIPSETVISIQEGYAFDPRGVAKRCTPEQAEQDACPAKSAVGTGEIIANYNGFQVMVPLRFFLTKPQQTGDLAGFAAIATIVGSTQSVIGRVVNTTELPFGTSIILPTPGGDFGGLPVTFESLTSDIGAPVRTVKKKVGKGKKRRTVKRRYTLIRNPKTCTETWASRAAFTFGDGTMASLDAPIACTP